MPLRERLASRATDIRHFFALDQRHAGFSARHAK
jgi:hypothetical protein